MRRQRRPGRQPRREAQITWLSWWPLALSSRARMLQLRQFAWMSPAGFWLPRRSMIATCASNALAGHAREIQPRKRRERRRDARSRLDGAEDLARRRRRRTRRRAGPSQVHRIAADVLVQREELLGADLAVLERLQAVLDADVVERDRWPCGCRRCRRRCRASHAFVIEQVAAHALRSRDGVVDQRRRKPLPQFAGSVGLHGGRNEPTHAVQKSVLAWPLIAARLLGRERRAARWRSSCRQAGRSP